MRHESSQTETNLAQTGQKLKSSSSRCRKQTRIYRHGNDWQQPNPRSTLGGQTGTTPGALASCQGSWVSPRGEGPQVPQPGPLSPLLPSPPGITPNIDGSPALPHPRAHSEPQVSRNPPARTCSRDSLTNGKYMISSPLTRWGQAHRAR